MYLYEGILYWKNAPAYAFIYSRQHVYNFFLHWTLLAALYNPDPFIQWKQLLKTINSPNVDQILN